MTGAHACTAQEARGKTGKAAEAALQQARPFPNHLPPPAPCFKSKPLLALPNGIFLSENQCALTESTNVQLQDKWSIEEHYVTRLVNCTGVKYLETPVDLQLCDEHGCLRQKQTRETTQGIWKSKCLPLSLRFAGREMNPHAPVRKHPPALRSDHRLSGYLLPHHRQGHAAPSVIGKVWMPSPQPLRGCMPAEQVGSWGPQTGKVLVERRGCLEPRPRLTQPCTPDPARLAPQQRPRSSSSSAFSRNLRDLTTLI